MASLEQQLRKDRAQRDAAWALCRADVDFIQEDLQARSIGTRVADRVSEGALELADEATQYAEQNPYKAGGITAGVILFAYISLFRSD